MASAAAVEAASNVPSLPHNLDSDAETTGHVDPISSDDDADVRPRRTVEDDGHDLDDEEEIDDDDLFGDGDDDDQSPAVRKLDDQDLDSGDDEDRTDRVAAVADDGLVDVEIQELAADLVRHNIPEPSDNEVYLVRVPKFLSIEPTVWNHQNFQPPTTDHHSKAAPSQTFNAYNTALSTIRWRRSPSKPAELQSNARILRWSDGSLTLQFASDPLNQYDMNGNPLAPPQINPKIPTPTSQRIKAGRPIPHYNTAQDSFTYLAAPYIHAGIVRVTNKITTNVSINPVADSNDEAVEQLQNALALAAKTRNQDLDKTGGVSIMSMDVDPEAEILKAQAAAKEKAKQNRSREKAQERERDRANRTLGGRGLARAAGGLSLGELEGAGRGAGGAKKPRAKTGLRRDWSDDEDYGGRRHTREDEYDEEDDFIAASDEEDMGEASEEEEELEEPEEKSRRKDTQSPKRNRPAADDDEEVVANVARTKRRRVIDDDDDDE